MGYSPKSIASPKAVVDFDVTFTGSAPSKLLTLKEGSGFISSYENNVYRFITRTDIRAEVVNGTASFENVELCEGSLITTRTTVDGSLTNQRFRIENASVDVDTLRVRVFQSQNSSVFEEYTIANNILNIGSTDKIFFINEMEDEVYELFFGDGTLGKKLQNGEVVEISYVVTNGDTTNGARQFNFNGILYDESQTPLTLPFTISNVSTVQAAIGGAAIESISKIKYNAPKFFGSQNRAVTSTDYSAIVRSLYPSIADIIVFGGEDQEPPAYGKVFIAVKPSNAASLSILHKITIIKTT